MRMRLLKELCKCELLFELKIDFIYSSFDLKKRFFFLLISLFLVTPELRQITMQIIRSVMKIMLKKDEI
jgi:hypothetical protein